jgi:hypothetical protein
MRARWLVVALVLAGGWACRREVPPPPAAEAIDAGPPTPVRVGDWARYTLAFEQVSGDDRRALALDARLQVVALDAQVMKVLVTFAPADGQSLPPPFQRPLVLRAGQISRGRDKAVAESCEGAGRRWACSCWKVDQRGYDGPRSEGCVSRAGELAVGSGLVSSAYLAGSRFRQFSNQKVSLAGVGHDETTPTVPLELEPHEGNRVRQRWDNTWGSGLEVWSWANAVDGLERTSVSWKQAPMGADGGVMEADGRTFVPGTPSVSRYDALSYVELLLSQWLSLPWAAEGDAGQVELDGHLVPTVTVTRGATTETFAVDPWSLPAMRGDQFRPLKLVEGEHTVRVLSAQ